jgi:monoamine oxidase
MEYRDVDVCVVGAGFAGLAAARYLLDPDNSVSPLSVAVLEARDRVGGGCSAIPQFPAVSHHLKVRVKLITCALDVSFIVSSRIV